FSDGETLSGSVQAAAEKARKAGITLYTVGLGSDHGGPVPLSMPNEKNPSSPGGFLLGADGMPVTSALQKEALLAGAEKSGGMYIDGSHSDAAQALADYINSLSAESRLSGQRREPNPQWRIFILAAMACLAGARMIGFSRRESPKQGSAKSGTVLLCLLCLFLGSSCVNIQGKLLVMEGNFYNTRGFYTEAISSYLKALNFPETAPYAEYGLASAYFSLEENGAALERYRAAEKELLGLGEEGHGELKYRIYYNMGIIYFERGEYSEAVNAFREALKVDGSRIEAKRNLELSLLTLNRASPPEAVSSREQSENRRGSGGASPALFDYLRQKEQEQWKSREWTGENDSSGPDY
ncbi:MAG: tetratricopeptide repeat protein, partial [Treponema sp.]|nr:tetratricopeptide repeat protein [Treponema sp.]